MLARYPLLIFFCISSAAANALHDDNYTFVRTGLGFNNRVPGEQKIDGASWFIHGAYQVPAMPFVVNAGYSFGRVDKDEIRSFTGAQSVEIDGSSYYAGASVVLRPSERLHMIPSFTVGRVRNSMVADALAATSKSTALASSLTFRYQLYDGLWLNTGYVQQYHLGHGDQGGRPGYLTAGSEYQVNKLWGLGVNYRGNAAQYATRLYLKFFL